MELLEWEHVSTKKLILMQYSGSLMHCLGYAGIKRHRKKLQEQNVVIKNGPSLEFVGNGKRKYI